MGTRGSRNPILLDWFNVTYRSVILVSIIGIALLATAIGYWYYSSRVAPRTQASSAISRAETRLQEVGQLPVDDQVAQAKANARTALDEARSAFGSDDYDIALQAALRSENISIRLIDRRSRCAFEARCEHSITGRASSSKRRFRDRLSDVDLDDVAVFQDVIGRHLLAVEASRSPHSYVLQLIDEIAMDEANRVEDAASDP